MRRIRSRAAIAGALTLAALLGAALPAGAASVPRTRTYTAQVTAGAGRYAHSTGRARIVLTLDRVGTRPDPVYGHATLYVFHLTLRALGCRSIGSRTAPGCLALNGTLAGQAGDDLPSRPILDSAAQIKLSAGTGTVAPLGTVHARGEIAGTGFIQRGARSIVIRLAGARGSVTLRGNGPPVPGFTPP